MKLANKKILVTGGSGFLGSYVVEKLKEKGCKNIFIPRKKNYDLVKYEDIKKVLEDSNPKIIIHLAGKIGGIGANMKNPASFFYENLMMGVQLMEAARLKGIEKFVHTGTICSYPKFTPVPFKEEYLWEGYPEETNAPSGLAKKMLIVQSQAYKKQYDFNSINLLLVNLFGPRDNFNPESSHVIPAIIRNCIKAKENNENKLTLWGSGNASREFLYIEDAAEAVILATELYSKQEPVNIGSGSEIKIKDLAEKIKELINFNGEIVWDKSKPDGQPRRCLDTTKAYKEFGFKARTSLEQGLKKTIEWYLSNKRC